MNIGKGEQFKPEFLAIAPNNRIPAIVDRAPADGGEPIAMFESGAILLYLADKIGRFIPRDLRARLDCIQWLFWQMANLGPLAGQNHHFVHYAPERLQYAIDRYVNETGRLYAVLNKRLADREFIVGDYSIADIASYPWVLPERQCTEHRRLPAPETVEGGDQGASRDGTRLCAGQGNQSETRGYTHRRGEKDPVRADQGRRALNRPAPLRRRAA